MQVHMGFALFLTVTALAQSGSRELPLQSADGVEAVNVTVSSAVLDGKHGIKVVKSPTIAFGQPVETMLLLPDLEFRDGTIELELAGSPHPEAHLQSRGFVGVAFRLQEGEPATYECIYLRPTNGRAEDQVRRNHSVQYVSHPQHPWYRLRKESPGVYECYVDLEPDHWTAIKIEVEGTRAKLFVHGQEQPTLIVNDLKLGTGAGLIALWMHSSTIAHYRNLKVVTR